MPQSPVQTQIKAGYFRWVICVPLLFAAIIHLLVPELQPAEIPENVVPNP